MNSVEPPLRLLLLNRIPNKNRTVDDCVYTNLCWSLDDAMVESLDPEYIRGYFCFNLIGEPGGNCYNLVRMFICVMIPYH